MDENQRREVYDLFLNYEKLKKEGSYYDECDLVLNIARRISGLDQKTIDKMAAEGSNSNLLPIDSLFVDEVQDFTQAELYLLANLCRDPNNLFLAGDTAQSIAVGVDFRFTDVRQTFYNSFSGIEPKLLQLSHNYRSHAGILRLAACVVELLYHFFGNSLDKLPPDLGLFSGPKPVIMDVGSTQELVLMLQGAKRETSRIEFGAHQVVIVRNEEAKKTVQNDFGIDPDWVMTVQESKGLEFDDVLLYNFFSDSPAEDLWRAVSSYSEADIAAYYGKLW
jgi:superfamily I DNA/RNA helicase